MPESATKLIQFDPENQIEFIAPFNRPKRAILKMKNICDQTITFKIKTTAPYSYNVTPTNGYIQSNSIVLVKIIFIGNREQIGASKHKFLIQAAIQTKNANSIFEEIVPYEHKIKCLFQDIGIESHIVSASSSQLTYLKEKQPQDEDIELSNKINLIDNSSNADANVDNKSNEANGLNKLTDINDNDSNSNAKLNLNDNDNQWDTIFYLIWIFACILLCFGIVALKLFDIAF